MAKSLQQKIFDKFVMSIVSESSKKVAKHVTDVANKKFHEYKDKKNARKNDSEESEEFID